MLQPMQSLSVLHARARGRTARPRGLALVTVLWVLTLLALIAASFTHAARTEISLTRNLVDNAKAEALADAGVYRAILALLDSDPERAWRVDDTVYVWLYDGGEVRMAVQDEGGKLDLNRGNDRLMASLFRSVGLSEEETAAMVDRIADFRDPDDLHHAAGAEDPDYAAAGLPWGAKDAPFESVEELRQVLGMTAEIYERVAPALTLYAGHRPPYEPNAPPEVTAFYGIGSVLRDRQEAEGRPQQVEPTEQPVTEDQAPDPATGPAPLEAAPEVPATRSRVPVFTIHAEARLSGGGVFARRAVVRLAEAQGVELLDWSQGRRRLFPLERGEEETERDEDGGG